MKIKEDINKQWEVSIIEFYEGKIKKYKVTRRISKMSIAETKFFNSKEEAKKQFEEWLG